jgi:hypothetical protein
MPSARGLAGPPGAGSVRGAEHPKRTMPSSSTREACSSPAAEAQGYIRGVTLPLTPFASRTNR